MILLIQDEYQNTRYRVFHAIISHRSEQSGRGQRSEHRFELICVNNRRKLFIEHIFGIK